MELQRVIGLRRSVRYLDPERPVERPKIQKMLEAARRASYWGNVGGLRAVVIERSSAPAESVAAIEGAVGAYQVKVAPVVIVWYLDTAACDEQPDRLRELVAIRAMGVRHDEAMEWVERTLIPYFLRIMPHLKAPGLNEVDCGQGIANATLMAFDQGLGTCLVGAAKPDRLMKNLGLPETARPLVLQTVGYPAEDIEKAGQRPRLPFERLFSLNHFGEPFPRDPQVVHELEESGLIQRVGPDDLERRNQELEALAAKYNLPPY